MYVIYALIDPRNQHVRYVGVTKDVYDRFRAHVYGSIGDNPAKSAWLQELREANMMVVMQALEQVESEKQAVARESYWIQHYHQLGASLTNKIIPLGQDIVYVRTHEMKPEIRLGHRMTPSEQRDYVERLWEMGLSRSTAASEVRRYIPDELVRIVYRSHEPKIDYIQADEGASKDRQRPDPVKLLLLRGMVRNHASQNEIIAAIFPGMRNADAMQEYRKYLAALVEG